MIGLNTNILARYYVASNDALTSKQAELSRALIDSGQPICIGKTVLLELEWILRGHYDFKLPQVRSVFEHLLSLPHALIEDRPSLETALASCQRGLDFADAYHHASYSACQSVAIFDDKKFARKATLMGLKPPVNLPS
jgi:predicted nucleic-acid-binding protein